MEATVVITSTDKDDEISIDNLLNLKFTKKYDTLILKDILDFINIPIMDFLLFTKNKLNKQGKLIIQGYDLYSLAYSIVTDSIPTNEINNIIRDRRQLFGVFDIRTLLESARFDIKSMDLDGQKYIIEAETRVD